MSNTRQSWLSQPLRLSKFGWDFIDVSKHRSAWWWDLWELITHYQQVISRHVTVAAAGAPASHNTSELHHHSSSNTTEWMNLLWNLSFLQLIPSFRQSMKSRTYNTTNQTVNPWTNEWAKEQAASGPLIISLWIFLFLYFTISTDQNVCWNPNMVLFLVAVHNQNIAWQQILISS